MQASLLDRFQQTSPPCARASSWLPGCWDIVTSVQMMRWPSNARIDEIAASSTMTITRIGVAILQMMQFEPGYSIAKSSCRWNFTSTRASESLTSWKATFRKSGWHKDLLKDPHKDLRNERAQDSGASEWKRRFRTTVTGSIHLYGIYGIMAKPDWIPFLACRHVDSCLPPASSCSHAGYAVHSPALALGLRHFRPRDPKSMAKA